MLDHLFGLGAVPSPPDARDFPIADAYAATGTAPPETFAPRVVRTPMPGVINQGDTPQCVAYSTAGAKAWQDMRDQGTAITAFDEAAFFSAIGGTPQGAYLRAALAQLLKVGYPVRGHPDQAAQHRIKAYYAVPLSLNDLRAAIQTFGPVLLAFDWAESWFKPLPNGQLPAPDRSAGGHAIWAWGWDDRIGLLLRNSWGPTWGMHGNCYVPYRYLGQAWEAWKSVDVPEAAG